MERPVIEAKGLAGGYPGKVLWEGADFAIRKGEFVAVLGPNGAGKTSLFRMLLGTVRPLGGSLSLFGEPPRRGDLRIGYVPQRHDVDPEVRIEASEFVRLGLVGTRWGIGSANEGAAAVRAVLARVGADELAHRPLGTLSGGELQRIFLAQALVSRPEVLLLDEPFANLDLKRESASVGIVRDIVKEQGVTALLITHNVNPLLSALDQVLYLANGKAVMGSPETVLTSDTLSRLYGTPVEVLKDRMGRVAIIGVEDEPHHSHA